MIYYYCLYNYEKESNQSLMTIPKKTPKQQQQQNKNKTGTFV